MDVDPDQPAEAEDGSEEAEGDEEDEEGETEYVVEKIVDHRFIDDVLHLKVKWKGYEKKADQTWEPTENLEEGAEDILIEYYTSIGGKPEKKAAGKRVRPNTPQQGEKSRKRPNSSATSITPPTTGRRGTSKRPEGSWEDLIACVDTIEKSKDGTLHAYLLWTKEAGGKRTRHPIEKAVFKEGGTSPETKMGNGANQYSEADENE
ncbi:MAG: hypothetical protein M1837_002380 [Sclerophora amabilis]|nr:MAG: hypothetical protein M1837_002380 [Sclerophora amabilis]